MRDKYKVRFHLGKGKHYRHWQIIHPNGEREFIDPNAEYEWQLKMFNCRLVNNAPTAKKIYDGMCNKTVCSWIECSLVKTVGTLTNIFGDGEDSDNLYEVGTSVELRYNPRKNPFWVHSATLSNVDDYTFRHLFTKGNKIYIKER